MSSSTTPARRMRLIGAVAGGVLVFGACTASTPSSRRVALDVVETLDATDEQKQCMREKIEGYSNDDLEAMVTDENGAAIEIDTGDPTAIEGATPELQEFVDDLRTCIS